VTLRSHGCGGKRLGLFDSLSIFLYPSKSGIDVLESARGALALSLIFSTFIVLIGVYLENDRFSKYLQHTGWSLLIVGLAAEVLISAELWGIDTGITRLQQDKIFSLEKEIAPRGLKPEQQQEIADAIKPFSGMHFDIATAVEIEPMRLVDEIEAALGLGGWIEQIDESPVQKFNRANKPPVGERMVAGVWVLYPNWLGPEYEKAAKALRGAFDKQGIVGSLVSVGGKQPYDSVIHVWVGGKP
jgi:hypothetical protein